MVRGDLITAGASSRRQRRSAVSYRGNRVAQNRYLIFRLGTKSVAGMASRTTAIAGQSPTAIAGQSPTAVSYRPVDRLRRRTVDRRAVDPQCRRRDPLFRVGLTPRQGRSTELVDLLPGSLLIADTVVMVDNGGICHIDALFISRFPPPSHEASSHTSSRLVKGNLERRRQRYWALQQTTRSHFCHTLGVAPIADATNREPGGDSSEFQRNSRWSRVPLPEECGRGPTLAMRRPVDKPP